MQRSCGEPKNGWKSCHDEASQEEKTDYKSGKTESDLMQENFIPIAFP